MNCTECPLNPCCRKVHEKNLATLLKHTVTIRMPGFNNMDVKSYQLNGATVQVENLWQTQIKLTSKMESYDQNHTGLSRHTINDLAALRRGPLKTVFRPGCPMRISSN